MRLVGIGSRASNAEELGRLRMTEDEIQAQLPVIPHSVGADCIGCVVVRISGEDAGLFCNECGVSLGRIDAPIFESLISRFSIGLFSAPAEE